MLTTHLLAGTRINEFFPEESGELCEFAAEMQTAISLNNNDDEEQQLRRNCPEMENVKNALLLHLQSIHTHVNQQLEEVGGGEGNNKTNKNTHRLDAVKKFIEFVGSIFPTAKNSSTLFDKVFF